MSRGWTVNFFSKLLRGAIDVFFCFCFCLNLPEFMFQVFMLALTFLVLFLGNFLTTLKVVHQKVHNKQDNVKRSDWDTAHTWIIIIIFVFVFFGWSFWEVNKRPAGFSTQASVDSLALSLRCWRQHPPMRREVSSPGRRFSLTSTLLLHPVHANHTIDCLLCTKLRICNYERDPLCLWRAPSLSCPLFVVRSCVTAALDFAPRPRSTRLPLPREYSEPPHICNFGGGDITLINLNFFYFFLLDAFLIFFVYQFCWGFFFSLSAPGLAPYHVEVYWCHNGKIVITLKQFAFYSNNSRFNRLR